LHTGYPALLPRRYSLLGLQRLFVPVFYPPAPFTPLLLEDHSVGIVILTLEVSALMSDAFSSQPTVEMTAELREYYHKWVPVSEYVHGNGLLLASLRYTEGDVIGASGIWPNYTSYDPYWAATSSLKSEALGTSF
jgi:hypothetical protein